GERTAGYKAGGARGETARGKTDENVSTRETTSSQRVAGIIVTAGDSVATAEPAAEHNGQKCVAEGEADRSVQKWNCAPRKMIPRSNATTRTRYALLCMYLIRRSLGRIGCSGQGRFLFLMTECN